MRKETISEIIVYENDNNANAVEPLQNTFDNWEMKTGK
jgi:hypothetical protein